MSKRVLPLIPPGLQVQQVLPSPDRVVVVVTPNGSMASCPVCTHPSRRVHSRYTRTLADLPWQGRVVLIRVQARRFRCTAVDCPRRIFSERLDGVGAGPWSRRTGRLTGIQHQIGLALGGEAGARLAQRLAMPVSGDMLLRLVRRTPSVESPVPRAVGVDDWAWRRGRRYGTILVDLERHRVVNLLPDREADTLTHWLAGRPDIEVISRDRGAAFADAARRGAPQAVQVADRWHLLENLGQAVKAALDRHRTKLREAAQARSQCEQPVPPDSAPPPMTSAERRQWEGWKRRCATCEEVLRLHADGVPIKEIVRRLGLARGTVRRLMRGGQPEALRPRASSLAPHLTFLERRWAEGCRNGAQLWRELKEAGFGGGLRVVTEWAHRQRLARKPGRATSAIAAPSCRRVAMLLSSDPGARTTEQRLFLDGLFAVAPEVAMVHDLARRFAAMVRRRRADELGPWLEEAEASDLASFAEGLRQDESAVRAALTTGWSNGQVEGQITRLKLIKRSMYGRAKLDLLRARVLAA